MYRPEPFHELIAHHLEKVAAGEITRLMIFAPPQHGKSELASVRFPAWWLGKRPDDPVILTSYAAALSTTFSRRVRALVESEDFARVFPAVRTDPEHRTVEHWTLDGHRGEMLVAGVGGGITGHGAALGIIDDPFKDWEEAYSPSRRDLVWAWYRTVFRTRVWERGAIVLIMTRWHEDDIAGRLLRMQPEAWTVLRLPALAEEREERIAANKMLNQNPHALDPLARAPGEALAPGRYSVAALKALRADIGTVGWYAEYQGVPRPPEGSMFRREWFEIISAAPAQLSKVRYWDKAGTEGAGARSAGVLMGKDAHGLHYVLDVITGQWGALEREQMIAQTAQLDGLEIPVWMEQEGGSGGKESAEASVRNLAGFDVHTETVTGSKEVRARPLAAQCEAGNVKLLRAPWNEAFLEEITAFPFGRLKDQTDAACAAFHKLNVPDPQQTARAWALG
jgi:predicted phage terminase large subunit-like protein